MTFSATTVQSLKDILAAAVNVQDGGVPGITAVVFDKTGRELLVHSAGTLGASSAAPLTPAHVFWMASCTKVVTVVGVMQLVEAARLSLDDAAQLEALCPELRDVQVLRDDGALEPKRRGITLRMLLTHTSGCGYSIFSEKLRDHGYPAGFDEFSGRVQDLKTPLIAHPGESWQYGTSIDWAGIALERLTGVTLNEYIQTNICKPLGLDSVNMIPTAEMKANLAHMSFRDPTGKIRPGNHFYRQPLVVSTPEEEANLFHSGGAGLFAKPQEYCRILAVLLNDGTCPTTNVTLLSARTVADIFSNHIPQFPDFAQQSLPAARPELTNPLPYLYPAVPSAPQGWGLACMLNGGVTGRSESTGWWAGLANLFWWVDRERGVGGLVCAQVLPFADAKVMGAWFALETAVYAALEESK
ncbi:Beta-lactamase-type transpeptidase fold domain containing protein [Cordyceps militaris CM01]|uniref:Beta-lactamase-type transpeptidase fold domain containing protein n=1 Tax=Cordyceps militaris (strain CM01) TaxID=983644 RepID=G3JH07_CORMM|nr:Beta-lactamase-type transpeptidase fold domain containing protein [Cordyceps militaris CM01]EGX91563.1 Beta-lactamase-type transpeptidase fold domain containing protein [Cordyceps militaris CM01]